MIANISSPQVTGGTNHSTRNPQTNRISRSELEELKKLVVVQLGFALRRASRNPKNRWYAGEVFHHNPTREEAVVHLNVNGAGKIIREFARNEEFRFCKLQQAMRVSKMRYCRSKDN